MRRSPWLTLAVLAVAQFIVTLDITIVNVALPHIQTGLGFSTDNLQWVISAYTLLFGGFLLLGGRAADLLGRRRMFLSGLVLFGAASLVAGLSSSPEMLIAMRAVQGLGGALLSPAALSILTVTFAHGRARNTAMGVWGGLAGLGGTLGVVAGGILVDALGWRWVFFVNVPVVIALVAIAPLFVQESRAQRSGPRTFDLAGALLSTAGLLALVYGVVRAGPLGWGSSAVLGSLAGAVLLLGAFVAVEARSAAPLIPLDLFRSRGLTTASGALALNGATFLAMFFLTAIYLQEVRGDSALTAGLQFLPMGVAAVLAAVAASQLVTRIGTRPVQLAGSVASVAGLVLLSRAGAGGNYVTELLPGLVLFGVGIIGVGVPAQITAVVDFTHHHAGAASGVVVAFYQVGGALGLAVVTTLADSRVSAALAHGASPREALVQGFHRGLLIGSVFAVVNVAVTLASPRLRPQAEQVLEASVAA
ncbi:MAG: MFS transporter [Candidatus Dormibacteria bacterium]